MPRLSFDPAYKKAYRKFTKHNNKRVETIDEVLRRFAKDVNHPSLHLEKLSGGKTWTIRIDRGNRLFFVWSDTGDTAIFFYVGSHDAYRITKK